MSRLLFRMRGVPEDEAEEVRALLLDHNIEYFETHAGNWGISMPALWVNNEDQYGHARQLLDSYQEARSERMRRDYELDKQRGETRTMWHIFREQPLRFLAYMALIVVVLYLSLRFFVSF